MAIDEVRSWQSWFPAMYCAMRALSRVGKMDTLLELGMGTGTEINRAYCDKFGASLKSVEVRSDWFEKHRSIPDKAFLVPFGDADFICQNEKYTNCDIALVDGVNGDRVMCTNLLLHRDRTRVVICHDTEQGYHWDWVVVPDGVFEYKYMGIRPFTTLYFKDEVVRDDAVSALEGSGYGDARDFIMEVMNRELADVL